MYLEMYGTRLPQGIWCHMFPPAHRMPQLTSLILGYTNSHYDNPTLYSMWGAADLTSLVHCCPGLCHIDTMCLHPGAHASELRKLACLTSLHVHYASIMQHGPESFAASARGLAALTQLRLLEVKQPSFGPAARRVKVPSLLPLTSLTSLTELYVRLNDHDHGSDSDDSDGNHTEYSGPELHLHATQVSQVGTVAPCVLLCM